MLKLTRFEFRKFFRSGSFYFCTLGLIAMTVFSVCSTRFVQNSSGVTDPAACGLNSLMSALPTSSISLLLSIFIAVYVCEDYASGTIRNIITRGYSRFGVYISKFIVVVFATVIMSAVVCGVSYALGTYFWGYGDTSFGFEQLKILLYQLAGTIAYAAVFYALCSAIQKTGGSIACCVVLPLAVTVLLRLADTGLANTGLAEYDIQLSSYWIDNINHTLTRISVEADVLRKSLVCSGIYLITSLFAGWLAIMKREY